MEQIETTSPATFSVDTGDFRVLGLIGLYRDGAGKMLSCAAIDINASQLAPGEKRVKVEIDLPNDPPFLAQLLEAGLRGIEPFVIRSRQAMPVGACGL